MSVSLMKPEITVVIPIYNEQAGLHALFARLYPALDQLGESYEIVFVNDGSRDNSVSILAEQFRARPDVTRVVLFNGNYGHDHGCASCCRQQGQCTENYFIPQRWVRGGCGFFGAKLG